MRDWLTAFRPASFRGVGFKVDGEDLSGGRRLAIQPIAYADQSVIEDMGRDPLSFTTTAYVAGDDADSEAARLTSALLTRGPGALILPMLGAVNARVASFRRNRQKDVAGYVAFDIEFVEEGLAAVPFNRTAGAGAIAALFAAAAPMLGAALGLAIAGGSPDRERDAAANGAALARAVGALAGDAGAAAVAAIDGLFAADPVADPSGFAAASADAWRRLGLDADAEGLALALDGALVAPATPTQAVSMICATGALALATVRRDLPAQADAAAARERMGELVAPILAATGPLLGADAVDLIAGLTGQASRLIASASRAPLVAVELASPLSAATVAYALYGDAGRAGEIVARNRLGDPVFLPARVETLAH